MLTEQMLASNSLLTGQSSEHIVWLSTRIGIHQQMISAWQQLQKAAQQVGFDLQIASGFRDFTRQLTIWNNKFSGKSIVKDKDNHSVDLTQCNDLQRINAILLYSALPGASRHHWGTDIDVYAPNLLDKDQKLQLEPWEYQNNGPFASLTKWLLANCTQYGFYFPYDINRGGVAIEPWHISYAPLAKHYQQQLSIKLLKETITSSDIIAKTSIIDNLPSIYKQFIINVNNSET